jgi:hypothetical protein
LRSFSPFSFLRKKSPFVFDLTRFWFCADYNTGGVIYIMPKRTVGNGKPVAMFDTDGLTVRGKVTVSATAWSDFVFSDDYKLPSLRDVKFHIQQHKHLPDIPSEEEVKENGIDVVDMQARLLQKIEELTLYAIQQQETIDELKKEMKSLKNNK